MRLLSIIVTASICISAMSAAVAQEVSPETTISTATLGLRGGYDSNPADAERARGSAFITQSLNWDYVHGSKKEGYGLSLAMQNTTYDPRVVAANLNNALTLNASTLLIDKLALRGTLIASNEQTWSRKQNALTFRSRLDYEPGDFRFFGSLEGRIGALNERNYFALGSFLPRDENSVTVTALPGTAYKTAYGEVGLSLTAARTHYLEDTDYIGFRRDNSRVQPNVFYSGKIAGATLEGSVSPLNAWFPAKDFESLHRILYTAKLSMPFNFLTLDLASSRTVQETTLPFSVIDVVEQHEARLTAKYWEKNAISIFARQKTEAYFSLGAKATTRSLGLEYARNLDTGLAATAAVTIRRVKETGVAIPNGFALQFGLQKQFDFGKAEKKS